MEILNLSKTDPPQRLPLTSVEKSEHPLASPAAPPRDSLNTVLSEPLPDRPKMQTSPLPPPAQTGRLRQPSPATRAAFVDSQLRESSKRAQLSTYSRKGT